MRYAGIAAQMLLLIGLFTWAGVWLDGRGAPGRTPWFTIGLSLLGLGLALYQVIRSLTR